GNGQGGGLGRDYTVVQGVCRGRLKAGGGEREALIVALRLAGAFGYRLQRTVGCQGWQPRATRMYLLRVRCRRYPNAQTPNPTRSTLPDTGSGWFRRIHKPIRLDDQHIAGHFIQQAFGSMANQGA